ncbi:MAG: pentapeptide repeat-containing protein [Paracoccus sp. (in: a-proteobacteria)]
MPRWVNGFRNKWRRWLGFHWAVSELILGFVGTWLAILYLLALFSTLALFARTIGSGEGSLGAGALIVAILSAPFLIWNTVIRQTALNFQKEGHLTDRLAKAVEQLGTEKTVKKIVTGEDGKPTTEETSEPNLEVRIGGLLSLERIAQDSTAYDKGRDHVRVMEIICAYIRNNAPASKAQDFPEGDLDELADDADAETRKAHLALIRERAEPRSEWLAGISGPTEDIALALHILGRRSDRQRRIEAAHGQGSVTEADWPFDHCPAELPDPPNDQPHPPGAIDAFRQKLESWQAKRRGYRGYRLDLRGTCLQCADLSGFRLGGARMEGARMEGAVLIEARMDAETDLRAVDFSGAALRSADYGNVRITQDQVNASFGDASVILPPGVTRPPHWPDRELPDRGADGEPGFFDAWRRWRSDPANQTPPPEPADR